MPKEVDIDLDAVAGELEPRTVKIKGQVYIWPAELPADVLLPLLDEDLDLVGVVRDVWDMADDSGSLNIANALDKILGRQNLPKVFWERYREALSVLFDAGKEGQAEQFFATSPSLPQLMRVTSAVWRTYGVSLGEASAPSGQSDGDGSGSKETSSATTE